MVVNEVVNVIKPGGNFVLVGDYNLVDSITWVAEPDGCCSPRDVEGNIAESFVDMLSVTGLNQFNAKRNRIARTLDLVLSNVDPDKLAIDTDDDSVFLVVSHHPPVTLLLDVSPLRFLDEKRPPKLNFFRADYDAMSDRLNQVDWFSEFCDLNVDAAVQKFYNLVSSMFDSVPTVRSAVKTYPCWFTKDLVKMLKQKVRARVKFLRTKDPTDYALFAGLRKEFKTRKRLCEEAYVDDIEQKVTVNTKAFFSYAS
ncbi:uncharacterized protein LOC119069410 [Bradysia coprophila]|uniref:uncharacterized protein LOC119069410 n=1 Tax=Bradysia coprophila TaxID=38358 RepID=UPI00187D8FAA|nr:uncharacterized protein LOC119069410 [Bradysia coprophila]